MMKTVEGPRSRLPILRKVFRGIDRTEALQIPYGHRSERIMACARAVALQASKTDVTFYVKEKFRGNRGLAVSLNVHLSHKGEEARSRVSTQLGKALMHIYGVSEFRLMKGVKEQDLYNFFADVLLGQTIFPDALKAKGIVLRLIRD